MEDTPKQKQLMQLEVMEKGLEDLLQELEDQRKAALKGLARVQRRIRKLDVEMAHQRGHDEINAWMEH